MHGETPKLLHSVNGNAMLTSPMKVVTRVNWPRLMCASFSGDSVCRFEQLLFFSRDIKIFDIGFARQSVIKVCQFGRRCSKEPTSREYDSF